VKKELENAKSVGEVFAIVKRVAKQSIGLEQAGLLVAVSDLGAYPGQFVGAFYDMAANTIVINKRPLQGMPTEMWNKYFFHVLLHEYLHSLGYLDEIVVRQLVADLIRQHFGDEVPTTIEQYMRYVIPGEPKNLKLDYISGIDRQNTNYIL
jgi:hypothetical protein